MIRKDNTMRTLTVFSFAALIMIFAGCSNDESGHSHHAEARGVVLYMNAVEIARLDSTILTGQITIPANNQISDHIEVKFIADDEDRDLFQPQGADHWMKVNITDTTIASVYRHNDSDAKWEFHLRGKTVDTTDVQIQIYHVDHPDFTTPVKIPVVVTTPPVK